MFALWLVISVFKMYEDPCAIQEVPFHSIKIGVKYAVSVQSYRPDIFSANSVCNERCDTLNPI
jgi:hypothetical protein